jgi:hypothetical protein
MIKIQNDAIKYNIIKRLNLYKQYQTNIVN